LIDLRFRGFYLNITVVIRKGFNFAARKILLGKEPLSNREKISVGLSLDYNMGLQPRTCHSI
jgi:hypothetical protein